jgi:hypothetical protein
MSPKPRRKAGRRIAGWRTALRSRKRTRQGVAHTRFRGETRRLSPIPAKRKAPGGCSTHRDISLNRRGIPLTFGPQLCALTPNADNRRRFRRKIDLVKNFSKCCPLVATIRPGSWPQKALNPTFGVERRPAIQLICQKTWGWTARAQRRHCSLPALCRRLHRERGACSRYRSQGIPPEDGAGLDQASRTGREKRRSRCRRRGSRAAVESRTLLSQRHLVRHLVLASANTFKVFAAAAIHPG